jgi:WD40 repeat protein/predicted Ser/Thr protein kinase
MADDQSEQAWAIFDQLADVPADQREAVLRAACGEDQALRGQVERLLAVDDGLATTERKAGFLQSPLLRPASPTGPATQPALPPQGKAKLPDRIGRYRVLRLLGEGGMGAVYEAEQDSPHRTVALKVIRPGLLAPGLLQRFAQEVEILGRLHHPGIAQIYEAGVAEDGQPFFAMEFIRGLTLDEYARLRSRTVPDRVELLARVCDAVQHAHEQGVIHRDLKPANILVEETGQPKVLDFGVARATDVDLLTGAGLTRTGQLVGTPNYMSPEQVTADPAAIDRRADVYALGVILFELLAHRLPYQLDNRPLAEVARMIREEEPPRLGSVHPELRGDVETIVAKSLAKDPARRYATAAELAADLRRWLAHEPIRARPPSALYHLRQFARRHTGLVGGVLATGLALVLGLVFTTLFAVGEARQRGEAEQNARLANAEKREAQFQTYRARIAAAVAALSVHDVADAARQLDDVPEELRGWEWQHLRSRLDDSASMIPLPAGEKAFLLGAPNRLQVAALTPAGLRLTDLEGSEPRALSLGPEGGEYVAVTSTRRGLRIVRCVGAKTHELLDEAGRVLVRTETIQHTDRDVVAVSPDGARLACPEYDGVRGRAIVYDVASGKRTAASDWHRGGIRSLAFSPNSTRLASGGQVEDRMVRVWDAASGVLLATCRGHTSRVLSIAFRPDGNHLLTTSSDGTVRQWDAATGQEVGAPYDRHTGEVIAAAYSPDGALVASAGIDTTVHVWQALDRQDVAILHGHTGAVSGVAFFPGGRRLASLSVARSSWEGDATVRTWNVGPGATLPVLRGHVRAIYPVAFSPDGRWIASGSWDGTLRLWDAATGEPCATLPDPGIVGTLAYGPDGTWLVSGNFADDKLRIWDMATTRIRKKIQVPAGRVRFVTVRSDGRRVAATAFDPHTNKHSLDVCDLDSGERLYSAPGRPLAYSPDGRWLAVRAADDVTVLLLDSQTHETVARFRGHEKEVHSAAFSPDSRRLATCSADWTVRVWTNGSGACQLLHGHTGETYAAAFHPDGTRLATGGRDRSVWLWDLARGEAVARLQGHASFVWSLAFSPDGSTLVSGSGDTTVRLWDTAPLKTRYQARRDAEALRPKAEQLVDLLWQKKKQNPQEVVAALRADATLREPLRQAALRAVLRKARPPEAAPGKPNDPP